MMLFERTLLPLFCIIILCCGCRSGAQEKKASVALRIDAAMEGVRNDKPDITELDYLVKNHGAELMPGLITIAKEGSAHGRWNALALISDIGRRSGDSQLRRSSVEFLLDAAVKYREDQDLKGLRGDIMRWLLEFGKSDFNEHSKAIFGEMLEMSQPTYDEILLCGIAGMKEEIPRLRTIIREPLFATGLPQSEVWWYSKDWAAIKALACMGDKEEISRTIRVVRLEPDVNLRFELIISLSTVRVQEVVDYLDVVLESDEKGPSIADLPESADTVIGMNQAAATALSRMVDGFPVRGASICSKTEVEICRKWMREHKAPRILR